MAERYISIDNVVGSGKNGKVMLSDLDLTQDDMARFSSLLTSYIKSGDFAADLTSPDWYSSGPSNYNIIPYMDSFENYIDKEILGPDTGITVRGTNLRAYNGYVSAEVKCTANNATKYLHSDTNTSAAWITVGTGTTVTTKYYLSGYFWFIGTNSGITLEIINDTEPSRSGSIVINSSDVDNATNRWTRFSSGAIILNEEDLITFKLTVKDIGTVFYMDALQLEIVVDGQEIQPFIQSGVVITDGSNIRVNSLAANAIKAYSITTSKLDPGVGNELVISGNTSIVAQRNVVNMIPYTTDASVAAHFEQGVLDSAGIEQVSTTYIRTSYSAGTGLGLAVTANTDYVIRMSSNLTNINSKIFFYNSSHELVGTGLSLNSATNYVRSGSTATYARITLAKDNSSDFTPDEIINYYAIMEPVSAYLSGANYRFDGTGMTVTNGAITIKNSSGINVLYADINGDLILKGNLDAVGGTFTGDISAASGTFTGNLKIGSGESVFKADSNGIYLGNENFSSAEFRVTPYGALTATGVNISGSITATSGSFSGSINSTSGLIGGFTLNSDYLKSISGGNFVELNSNLSGFFGLRVGAAVANGLITRYYGGNIDNTNGGIDYPMFLNGSAILTTSSTATASTKGPIIISYDSGTNTLYIGS